MVCHDDGDKKYLISNDIIKNVQWNTINSDSGGYEGSNIKKECDQFAILLNQSHFIIDTGPGKVFIPTSSQLFGKYGGFSWFESNSRRIANYNGNPSDYWLSNSGTYISASGVTTSSSYIFNYFKGFRPCICIQTS